MVSGKLIELALIEKENIEVIKILSTIVSNLRS
jgi:hypothetical protein